MSVRRCPDCHDLSPDDASYCATCGNALLQDEQPTQYIAHHSGATATKTKPLPQTEPVTRSGKLVLPVYPEIAQVDSTTPLPPVINKDASTSPGRRITTPLPESLWDIGDDLIDLEPEELPMGHATWQKDVESHPRRTPIPFTPRPTPSQPTQAILKASLERRRTPAVIFWASMGLLVVLVFGGVFGVITSFGRGTAGRTKNTDLALHAFPQSVVVGATVTLRGSNFSARGRVGLTRDAAVPIVDTGGAVVSDANANGDFTDTLIVGEWGNGPHTLHAEDAVTHKIASFPIVVSGQSTLLRPAHLQIAQTGLDLGAGDPATNTSRTLTLTNIGSGQISWQSSASQPWLQISPASGILYSGVETHITVVAARANMQPGTYSTPLTIASNAGNASLPVRMQVTPLQANHEAVLQINSAALSFNASDGATNIQSQKITINNPGAVPLNWSASTSLSWLSISPASGVVQPSGSGTVQVAVHASDLLPGTYSGTIALNAQGAVNNSPQTVVVSLTIAPPCSLQLSPEVLSFASAYQQSTPAAKVITVGAGQGCSSAVHWSASSQAGWLTLDKTSGVTPAYPSIGINPAGLAPGTYNSAITFSSAAGTETLPVSFTLSRPLTPIMTSPASTENFSAVVGSGIQPAAQMITLTNSGGAPLNWNAAASTNSGGSWLTVTPTNGTLPPHQSTSLQVQPALLSALMPGSYSGSIMINGQDQAGNVAAGSPLTIPVNFRVNQACTVSVPSALSFTATVGQSAPAAQTAQVSLSGSCAHTLNWNAAVAGGSWLQATSASGSATLKSAGTTSITVLPNNLAPGVYHGTVTISATDSATQAAVSAPQQIAVTLTVQASCAVQVANANPLNFNARAGSNAAAQTMTVSTTGNCSGNVTVTPAVSLASGSGWLVVSPTSHHLSPGGSTNFTVNVQSANLAPGIYTGSITLNASTNGTALPSNPQTLSVTLTVAATPALSVNPTGVIINTTASVASQPVTISNTGGGTLNWTAVLDANTPQFITLSNATGNNLAGGNAKTITVNADPTNANAVGGQSYTTHITFSATNAVGGQAVGSPIKVPVTVNIASPSMQLNATRLEFSTMQGNDPQPQSLSITNAGGNSLSWQTGPPSASWLSVSPNAGTEAASASSNVTFSVHVADLQAGSYYATVAMKPSVGAIVRVKVLLSVTSPPVTPVPTATAQATTTPPPEQPPSPTVVSPPTTAPPEQPSPTVLPRETVTPPPEQPTATALPRKQPTPTVTPIATAEVTPTATSQDTQSAKSQPPKKHKK